jgi:hypothetical protein
LRKGMSESFEDIKRGLIWQQKYLQENVFLLVRSTATSWLLYTNTLCQKALNTVVVIVIVRTVESFNLKLRDELLNREIFDTLLEVRVLLERWHWEYNCCRPNSSLS